MDVFTAAPHHDVLALTVQVAVLLITARAFGFTAGRFGQPAVVGEILSGVVLGPSLLSALFPALGAWVVPQNEVQGYLLEVVALLGAMFLLLMTGLEIDLPLIRRQAKTALGVAAGGLVLPLVSGFVMALYLPDFLLADPERRLVFALFVATAMSISAIPVIAKVLIDLNLMRRDLGQTVMAAGMVDDTAAWILLSIVLGLAGGGAVTVASVGVSAGKILLFMGLSFTLGRAVLKRALDFMQDRVVGPDRLLTLVVAAAFVWGAVAQAIRIEAVLGAFVVGVLFGTMRRLPIEVVRKLESVAIGVFAPVFFAVAGLKVNVPQLLTPQLLLITALVLGVAIFGKMVGAYLGGRAVGTDHVRSLAYGSALNARGAVGIIIATIGLSLGILGQDMYSIIVLTAVVTSLMAPVLLQRLLGRIVPDEQETRRLEREALADQSLLARTNRVLMPVRKRGGGAAARKIEPHLFGSLGDDLALTLLNVTGNGGRAQGLAYLSELGRLFGGGELSKKVVEGNVVDAILDEAQKDYDLIILGATEKGGDDGSLFNPVTDHIVRLAPCPTLVVKGVRVDEHWPPKRILVPTNGSASSRYAAEVAFALAKGGKAAVTVMSVVEGEKRGDYRFDSAMRERQLDNARSSVTALQGFGEVQGVVAETQVLSGALPEEVILDYAERGMFDLIVLGTDLRGSSERVFLGSRVEAVLDGAACPVVVVNAS